MAIQKCSSRVILLLYRCTCAVDFGREGELVDGGELLLLVDWPKLYYVIRNPHLATTSLGQSQRPFYLCDDHLQLTTTRAARMFAARSRAVCAARQLQRTTRTYASESHGHHSPAPVNESFGVSNKARHGTKTQKADSRL